MAEAQELVAFRRSPKQREIALATQAQQLAEREAAIEKKAFDVAVAQKSAKDSEAALDAREVVSILRIKNAHQAQLEVRQADDRARILLKRVEGREALLAAKWSEEREAEAAMRHEVALRETALRAEERKAGAVLDDKRREIHEKCQKLEKKLEEVLTAQEKLHTERAVLERRTAAFEARKSELLSRLGGFVATVPPPAQKKGSENSTVAEEGPTPLGVDIQRGRDQLDFLGAFAVEKGLPLQGLEALAQALDTIEDAEQMDRWWHDLGLCSQSMTVVQQS